MIKTRDCVICKRTFYIRGKAPAGVHNINIIIRGKRMITCSKQCSKEHLHQTNLENGRLRRRKEKLEQQYT